MQVVDGVDLRLQQLIGAAEAGTRSGEEIRARDRRAGAGGREQRVLLGVDADADVVRGARFVVPAVRAALAAALVAVGHARGRAVVAGRDHAVAQY